MELETAVRRREDPHTCDFPSPRMLGQGTASRSPESGVLLRPCPDPHTLAGVITLARVWHPGGIVDHGGSGTFSHEGCLIFTAEMHEENPADGQGKTTHPFGAREPA